MVAHNFGVPQNCDVFGVWEFAQYLRGLLKDT